MKIFKRRDFFKTLGFSVAITLGTKSAFEMILPGYLDAAEKMKPLSTELLAKRWGMVIDIKKLTPELRKSIIQACHIGHNVPIIDPPKNIKWIWETSFEKVFAEFDQEYLEEIYKEIPVLALCNHCDNPPCVRVCPTKATFRRSNGIVLMDMHRCIGCRFCMAACPFGSRSFNFYDPRKFMSDTLPNKEYPTRSKGVVEKCTFCSERLAIGQLPYCVEASNKALLIGDMNDASSVTRNALRIHFSIRRNPGLGTQPQVYYLV